VFDYVMEPLERVELAADKCDAGGVQVRVVEGAPAPDEVQFVSRQLHEAEFNALALDHAGWGALAAKFSAHGLLRKRFILIARDASGSVVGSAVCNLASEGMNFSFLENALEYVFIAPEPDHAGRMAVLAGLLRAGCDLMKKSARDYLVCMSDPGLAPLLEPLGLRAEKPKQYAVATYSANADEIDAIHQATIRYYRELLTRHV
jgi:hypothetical protein